MRDLRDRGNLELLRLGLLLEPIVMQSSRSVLLCSFFFFQAEDGIRDYKVTGVQTCALPISMSPAFLDDDEAEDVHHFVEKQLVVMIGDVGYKLHSGRSRNEQIAT